MMESATLRGAAANSDVPRSSAPSVNDFVSSMAHQAIRVSEVKVPSNGMMLSNGNHHMAHEEVSAMLGLQMVDSVCSSDMVDNISIKSTDGIILPRSGDGKLRYVGGVKHIVSLQKNITWE
ncbi:hypothetical protein Tco_0042298, partial [Tanacetum coccineum]